jgi:hypothetical protein
MDLYVVYKTMWSVNWILKLYLDVITSKKILFLCRILSQILWCSSTLRILLKVELQLEEDYCNITKDTTPSHIGQSSGVTVECWEVLISRTRYFSREKHNYWLDGWAVTETVGMQDNTHTCQKLDFGNHFGEFYSPGNWESGMWFEISFAVTKSSGMLCCVVWYVRTDANLKCH